MRKKYKFKLNFNRMIENGIVSIIAGIIVALFTVWATKVFGMQFMGG